MKKRNKLIALALTLSMALVMMPVRYAHAEDGDWLLYQNSPTNNGIINNPKVPYFKNQTAVKWKAQITQGYTNSFTPPLIKGDYLYAAADKRIYKIDRNNGDIVAQSQKFANKEGHSSSGAAGYGLHPITYHKGMFFVQIGSGRIQAFDAETLKSVWVADNVDKNGKKIEGQSLCTIAAHGDYVYTGYWNGEQKDGAYVAYNIKDDIPDTGYENKKPTWSFWPSKDDPGSKARGFYWAGAYVTDKYIVFGSDNGTGTEGDNGDGAQTAKGSALYVLDAKSGEIIDKHDNLVGDIRSNIVYHEGEIFWNSKGGYLYKSTINAEGELRTLKELYLKGMMTAAPVVYKNRIYVGVCGKSQFAADSGHKFVVVKNKPDGGDITELYGEKVKGYPQAAALLSTAHEQVDFTGENKPTGRVYLYFTYNHPPGGIGFLYDQPDKTAPNPTEQVTYFYKPPAGASQYGISPLAVDKDGVMYYKNDSGVLFAIEQNMAYIEDVDIEVKDAEGNLLPVDWGDEENFHPQVSNYDISVPSSSETASFGILAPDDGGKTKVYCKDSLSGDDELVEVGEDGIVEIDVPEQGAVKAYTVIAKYKGSNGAEAERSYTFNILREEEKRGLKEVKLSRTNTYPSTGVGGYDFDEEYLQNNSNLDIEIDIRGKRFLSLWTDPVDKKSNMFLIPESNFCMDRTTGTWEENVQYTVGGEDFIAEQVMKPYAGTASKPPRFAIYPDGHYEEIDGTNTWVYEDLSQPTKFKIVVQNADKSDAAVYDVTFTWTD